MGTPYSPDHKVINAVRSPLGMGALIVLSLTMVFLLVLPFGMPWQFKAVVFGVYAVGLAVVFVWTVVMTFKHPRHFAYGPSELLENNRIDHDFNLAMRKLELEHHGNQKQIEA